MENHANLNLTGHVLKLINMDPFKFAMSSRDGLTNQQPPLPTGTAYYMPCHGATGHMSTCLGHCCQQQQQQQQQQVNIKQRNRGSTHQREETQGNAGSWIKQKETQENNRNKKPDLLLEQARGAFARQT